MSRRRNADEARINARVDARLVERMDRAREAYGWTRTEFLRQAVESFLDMVEGTTMPGKASQARLAELTEQVTLLTRSQLRMVESQDRTNRYLARLAEATEAEARALDALEAGEVGS